MSDPDERLPVWSWLAEEKHRELRVIRQKLARRLTKAVRPLAKRKVEHDIRMQEERDPSYEADRSAVRALVTAETAAASHALAQNWLDEIERCFLRMRGIDPQFFLHPPNLDGAMLPVRSLSQAWARCASVLDYGDDGVRAALAEVRTSLAERPVPFPPEAIRYFEILGCFVSSRSE